MPAISSKTLITIDIIREDKKSLQLVNVPLQRRYDYQLPTARQIE